MLNGVHYDEPTEAEIKAFREEHRLANDAYWNKKETRIVTTRTQHLCEKCATIIIVGSKAKVRSVVAGTGWPFSLVTKYSHEVCP